MGSIKHFACAVVASTALTASLLPVPAFADDADPASSTDGFNALSTFPEFASMVDSATTDAALMLEGTIKQITGADMPGAQVLLWAWPSNETVKNLVIGGELELTPIARTVADEDGKYTLRAPVTELLRSLSGPDGLDIQLEVFHGDLHYTYLSQVTPTPAGTWVREITGLVDPVADVAEAAANLLDLTLDRTKAAVEQGLGITGSGPVRADYRKPVPPGCTPFEKVGVERVWETVATAVARGGAAAEVVYQQNARTESSTGASIGGVFSINGSRSRVFGFEAEFDPEKSAVGRPVNTDYRVEMEHVTLRRSCAKDFRGGEDVLFITSPLGGATGGVDYAPAAQPAFSCTPGDGRTVRAKAKRVKASKFRSAVTEAAFSFEPVKGSGFTGKALSGFDKTVTVAFTFKGIDPDKKWWCGHTGVPLSEGQRVQGFVK